MCSVVVILVWKMGLIDLVKPLSVGGIKSNMTLPAFNGTQVGYDRDHFQSTSVSRFMTEPALKYAIASNPRIKEILKEMKAPVKLNMNELQDLMEHHAKETQEIASGIIANLPRGLKEHVNVKSVKDAAYLHDIGKVLIPAEVLNKAGSLNEKEKEIMHRHSELGYELLKNTDIDTRTLNLVKYHHQNSKHSGYPKAPVDFFADINQQIVSAADKYSALLENRVYKKPMTKQQALAIIYKDVIDGNLHPFVFKALLEYSENVTQKRETFV